MARLAGSTKRTIDVKPVGYQFPLCQVDNDWDANWLNIRVAVNDGDRRWSAVDPAFLTWDLSRLVDWLRALVGPIPVTLDTFVGMEGNLGFERRGSGDSIRVTATLSEAFAPPDAPLGSHAYRRAAVEFSPGIEGLKTFADELERELVAFPIRVIEHDGPARRYLVSPAPWTRTFFN